MRIIPIFELLVLPHNTYYFKREALIGTDLEEIRPGEEILFMLLKSRKDSNDLEPDDFYPYAIKGLLESIDGDGNRTVKTFERVRVTKSHTREGGLDFETEDAPVKADLSEREMNKRLEKVRSAVLDFIKDFQWGIWARGLIIHWNSLNDAISGMAPFMNLSQEERFGIISAESESEKSELIEKAIFEYIEVSKVSDAAEKDQKERNEKIYREDAIKKQIRYLQNELDEMHPENVSDVRRFEQKLEKLEMNETAKIEAMKVLNRMKQEGKDGHEYGLLYDYLDFVTSLSWSKEPVGEIDLKKARGILDRDHHGMKKVKDRIIQQMAVMALNQKQTGSILLFVGAPGTGKTSIGQGIAEALGRKYVRVSLGGVRDEAEIRGHRRTYVGAMPGRIMEGVKRSGVSNPVIVLDEVDKLSRDYSGDPASALLEVLDPEQNNNFTDHYLNVPYDLSDVLFVCTANSLDTIPEPLLNRMETIQFPGYTSSEKIEIAKRHLLPKTMEQVGIKPRTLKVTDDAIRTLISDYTRESGVRGLKRQLETICRYAAVKLVMGEQKSITVSPKKLASFLDQKPIRHESILEKKQPGVVTGLAWTSAGGEVLFIESILTKGEGKVKVTGQLGDVMKESVQIALSIVKARYPKEAEVLKDHDLHIHFPAGAVPKDGPSAGITITTALSSLLTNRPVDPIYAMTGEVSLRQNVMPIGGLPEKLMAAVRAGIQKVFIPFENVEDLEEVPDEIKEQLEIIPVKRVDQVLKTVFGE